MNSPQRPARVPEALFTACGYFLPRLMFLQSRHAPQVHWGDIALALHNFPIANLDLGSGEFWDEWRRRWVAQAERYGELALTSSTAAGRARAYRSAAACCHWAEFMDFGDVARKTGLRKRVRSFFDRSLIAGDLDMARGEVQLVDAQGSWQIPYWLLRPPAYARVAGPLPCVLLSNGLDSMTEVEVLALAEPFLERGMAALLFEGPGQGLSVGQVPLRIEMETVVAALVDRLKQYSDIEIDRLGFLGVSFGGYFALRVAQSLGSSFRCIVNLSGGPRVASFAGLPRRLKDDFSFAFMGGDARAMQAQFDALAIDTAVPAGTNVLSIHGALDDIFHLDGLLELDRAWQGRHRLIVYPREAHVCLNEINACSVVAADWVEKQLMHVE